MNIEQHFNGSLYETCWTLEDGQSKTFRFATTSEALVVVHALGAGVSAYAEISASPLAEIDAGTARFFPAYIGTGGTVSDASARAEVGIPLNALRVTASGGPVIVEVLQ